MLKTVSITIAVLAAALLTFAAVRPDSFRVQRSASIKAPPEKIFALIEDFEQWGKWSPYEKLDPAMKRSITGAPKGAGAVYAWEGNSKAGAGRMEITDAQAPSKVLVKLDFAKPFEAHNIAEFTLAPKGDATEVTWAMYGPQPYLARLVTIFFNMDRMVGGAFEEGLANLKAVAEK